MVDRALGGDLPVVVPADAELFQLGLFLGTTVLPRLAVGLANLCQALPSTAWVIAVRKTFFILFLVKRRRLFAVLLSSDRMYETTVDVRWNEVDRAGKEVYASRNTTQLSSVRRQ